MTSERRAGWISNLSRFTLGDLAIFVGVIVFLVSPHPDAEARANLASISSKVEAKQDKISADADQRVILEKLKGIEDSQKRIEGDLRERLERLEKQIDQPKR
jgi:hypothetical protein